MYDFVLQQLDTTKGAWSRIAKDTGISKRTIEKIARQEVKNPGVHSIQALNDYFVNHMRKT